MDSTIKDFDKNFIRWEDLIEDDETITGNNCPRCGYPLVIECGLDVCYHCGWSEDCDGEDIL